MWHTGKIVDKALLQKEADDVVHAIVLGFGSGCTVEAGGRGTGLHNGTDDAHHCLQPGSGKASQAKVNKLTFLIH